MGKLGLVLEGGGMRGFYTIGVLDFFMEQNFFADYVIGVSAGAGNGVSYVSNQKGRCYTVNTKYLSDKRYLSLSSFIKTKSLFGMDFIFKEIPDTLEKFDYDAFSASKCEFVAGVTDVFTGKPKYFTKEFIDHDATVLRASSSIPIFSPIVEFNGGKYLDGGTSDPIPFEKALADGCDRLVVVLTRHKGYVKTKEKYRCIYKKILRKFPKMVELLNTRHEIYNAELERLFELEKQGKAIVIAPALPIKISRFEKNIKNLDELYEMGKIDAKLKYYEILELKKQGN
ncbi:MAG: patatin family protein [Oscillospiraceae bacterium]